MEIEPRYLRVHGCFSSSFVSFSVLRGFFFCIRGQVFDYCILIPKVAAIPTDENITAHLPNLPRVCRVREAFIRRTQIIHLRELTAEIHEI
ncbi:MAG: hypothetical protein ABI162_08595 [Luteolibacter sp.]